MTKKNAGDWQREAEYWKKQWADAALDAAYYRLRAIELAEMCGFPADDIDKGRK